MLTNMGKNHQKKRTEKIFGTFCVLVLYLPLDFSESIFFQSGHLRLRYADLVCNLHLSFSEKEAQVQNVLFTRLKQVYRFFQ